MCCNDEHDPHPGHHPEHDHGRHHGEQCECGGHHGEHGHAGGPEHHGGHACGCGDRHGHGCCCGEGEQGQHFRRRFHTREERLASLEAYLKDLQAEVKAVEEQMAELKAAL